MYNRITKEEDLSPGQTIWIPNSIFFGSDKILYIGPAKIAEKGSVYWVIDFPFTFSFIGKKENNIRQKTIVLYLHGKN